MKKTTLIFPISIIMINFIYSNCERDESFGEVEIIKKVEIIYPDSGYYGKNILNMIDTIYNFDPAPGCGTDNPNSMKAILPSNSKLRVEIKGIRVAVYQIQGWFTNADIIQQNNINNEFVAEGPISADLRIFFCGDANAIINIYENNDSIPSRIKHLIFEN